MTEPGGQSPKGEDTLPPPGETREERIARIGEMFPDGDLAWLVSRLEQAEAELAVETKLREDYAREGGCLRAALERLEGAGEEVRAAGDELRAIEADYPMPRDGEMADQELFLEREAWQARHTAAAKRYDVALAAWAEAAAVLDPGERPDAS